MKLDATTEQMIAEVNQPWIDRMDAPLSQEEIARAEAVGIFATGDPRGEQFWAEVEAGTRPDPRGIFAARLGQLGGGQ